MLAATHPAAALTARRRRADRAGLGRCAVRASAETDAAELASLSANKEGLAKHLAAAQERSTVPVDLEASKSAVVDTTALPEADKDTFYPWLAAAGDALVVVDFYTDWCGPCKLIAPKLVAWNAELQPKVQFIKFNCNKENKELGKALNIRVAPTFHLYRNSQQLAVLTGAKEAELRALIEQHM